MARYILLFSFFIITSIQGLFGQDYSNKTIPLEVESAVHQALTLFPELESYSIEFKFRKSLKNRVMQAQPKIRTFFKRKEHRQYTITMSRNLVMNDTIMTVDQLSDEVLVGWFVHELGHVMDYKDRSSGNLLKFALKYITSKPFLRRSELRADALATNHGGGKHLIKTKRFILFKSKFSKEYKAKIKELYPSPEEITAMLAK